MNSQIQTEVKTKGTQFVDCKLSVRKKKTPHINCVRVQSFNNSTTQCVTDLLSRVASLRDGSTILVEYEYSGSGTVITQNYSQPGITQTLFLGSGADPYAALDRFGRKVDLRWSKGSTDLVRFEYGYDRVSNRLFERNLINGSSGSNPAVDSLLGYEESKRCQRRS